MIVKIVRTGLYEKRIKMNILNEFTYKKPFPKTYITLSSSIFKAIPIKEMEMKDIKLKYIDGFNKSKITYTIKTKL
jgi:hypothetical protein